MSPGEQGHSAARRLRYTHALAGEQGVAAGALDELAGRVRRQGAGVGEVVHELLDRRALQRAEIDALGHGRARPARAPLEQLRARRHHHQQPGVRRRLDEALHEVEQRRVGMVQVLQHQHGGPAPGHGLEEQAPRRHGLLAARGAAGAGQPEQWRQVAAHPDGVRAAQAGAGHGGVELAARDGRLVRRQDAGLLRNDLAQGAEGRAVAVGRDAAAPPGRQPRRLGRDDDSFCFPSALDCFCILDSLSF